MSVYRDYSRAVWETVRGVVPTVERTGLDEGYLDLGEVCADVRARARRSPRRCRRRCAARRASRARSASARRRSSRRWRATGASRAGSPSSGRGARPRSWRRSTCACSRASARGPRSGCARLGLETLGALAALDRRGARAVLPGKVGPAAARPRARHRPARRSSRPPSSISMSHEETFARDVADRERLHDELRRMAARLAEHLAGSGRAARTVTTKVRYPDFAIRSRSTSLPVGTDDAGRHRRARVRPARPRARRPARRAAPRRRRRLEPRAVPAARAAARQVLTRLG